MKLHGQGTCRKLHRVRQRHGRPQNLPAHCRCWLNLDWCNKCLSNACTRSLVATFYTFPMVGVKARSSLASALQKRVSSQRPKLTLAAAPQRLFRARSSQRLTFSMPRSLGVSGAQTPSSAFPACVDCFGGCVSQTESQVSTANTKGSSKVARPSLKGTFPPRPNFLSRRMDSYRHRPWKLVPQSLRP